MMDIIIREVRWKYFRLKEEWSIYATILVIIFFVSVIYFSYIGYRFYLFDKQMTVNIQQTNNEYNKILEEIRKQLGDPLTDWEKMMLMPDPNEKSMIQ